MSIKVIDLQNEEVKEDTPTVETIEEAKEKIPEPEPTNEVVEEVKEEPKEEVKEEKPKRQTQKDRIQCPKCFKEMSVKSYRYSHEKICQGQLSEKPVKPHTNPRPKAKQQAKPKQPPKPPPEDYYSESDDDEEYKPLSRPVKNQVLKPQQPINPANALFQQYQFLQNQMMQQKQERYNNLCMNMFSSKSKKR